MPSAAAPASRAEARRSAGPLHRAAVFDGLALLDRGLHQPLDQRAASTSGRASAGLLAPDLHRAQHRRLQRRLVLLEVEGDPLVGDASPERKDQEARGQGQEGDVGEEAEAGDRPGLVAEVVHRIGGDAEGDQAGARARWPLRAAPTFSRQRRRTPRMTRLELVVVDVGHGALPMLARRAGSRLDSTVSAARNRQAATSSYRHSACRPSCSSVVSAGPASPRQRPQPCSCVTAPASSSGSSDARSDSDGVEVDRGHPRPAPALEPAHLVESRSRQLQRALPRGQPLLLARWAR